MQEVLPEPDYAEPETASSVAGSADTEPVTGRGPLAPVAGSSRISTGSFPCRYAGAMPSDWATRTGSAREGTFAAVTGGPARRYDDLAVLSTATLGFALGIDTVRGGRRNCAAPRPGAAVGLGAVPELKTLRTRLAALADGSDPLGLQRAFAAGMLAADPAGDPVYFVDDHFVPYAGARPVAKGWNTKRRHAGPGRDDTLLVDSRGRAVVFGSGEPTGLSKTLPGVLTQLRAVIGPHARGRSAGSTGVGPTRSPSPPAATRGSVGHLHHGPRWPTQPPHRGGPRPCGTANGST